MALQCHFRLPGGVSPLVDAETRPRILVLTATADDGQLTQGLGSLMLAQTRAPVSPSSLVLYDLKHPESSTLNPPDEPTRRALALLFIHRLMDQGLLRSEETSPGRHRALLIPDTKSSRWESGGLPFLIRPGNWQRALVKLLRIPAQIGSLGQTNKRDGLVLKTWVCPSCKRLNRIGRTCCSNPGDLTISRQDLMISLAVQRIIWLVCRLALQTRTIHTRLPQPSSILIVEPKLLSSLLNLFLQFMHHSNCRLMFRELIIWPPQAFQRRSPEEAVSRFDADLANLLVWPGWKSANQPPPGRQRHMLKILDKWTFLQTMANQGDPVTRLPSRSQLLSTAMDRWLLHSFNLMVAHALTQEENRRQALALDTLFRFISSTLVETWLRWRLKDWDRQSQEHLRTILPILENLLSPYGIFPFQAESRSRSVPPPSLYRKDWIYIREYKLVETAIGIHRLIKTLLSEIQRTGLEAKPQIGLYLSQPSQQPRDLIALLKRINPGLEIDFFSLARFKATSGLKEQEGIWRLVLGIEDGEMRLRLRGHYETRLEQEKSAYDGYKQLYLAHKTEERHLQSHLKTMRGKLLRLKKKQMITLSRIHELQ